MRLTLEDIRPILHTACNSPGERAAIDTLLAQRDAPDFIWVAFVADALNSGTSPNAVRTAAAAFAAAELATLLLDDFVDDEVVGDPKFVAVGISIVTAVAYKLVAGDVELTRLITEFLADAVAAQLVQVEGVAAESADYWAEAKLRVRPYYSYPFMMGAAVAGRTDVSEEMSVLGDAFGQIVIIHDDLQDLYDSADWEHQKNLVIQYALTRLPAGETPTWDTVRSSGALDYACSLWLDTVLQFDALWRNSAAAGGAALAAHWQRYLSNALPGLVYLSANVDAAKLSAVQKIIA